MQQAITNPEKIIVVIGRVDVGEFMYDQAVFIGDKMHGPLRFVAATSHGFKISYQYWVKGKPLPVVRDYYFSENLGAFTVIELAQR